MNPPIALAVRLAGLVLDPGDVDRVLMPALADALDDAPEGSRQQGLNIAAHLLWVALACFLARRGDAIRETRWWAAGAAALASAVGCLAMQATDGGRLAAKHAVFSVLGLAVALSIAVVPRRWLMAFGALLSLSAIAALAIVPWAGADAAGARRWLQFGSLMIQVSTLALPAFAWALAASTRGSHPRIAYAAGLIVLGLVAVQRDPAAVIIYALVAWAAAPNWTWRAVASAPILALVAFALANPLLTPPAVHVEGAIGLLASRSWVWLVVGLASVCAVAAQVALSWWRARKSGSESSAVMAATSSAALLGLLVIPRVAGDGGVPWLSFGGSAVVAAFALVGLILRAERDIRRPAAAV